MSGSEERVAVVEIGMMKMLAALGRVVGLLPLAVLAALVTGCHVFTRDPHSPTSVPPY